MFSRKLTIFGVAAAGILFFATRKVKAETPTKPREEPPEPPPVPVPALPTSIPVALAPEPAPPLPPALPSPGNPATPAYWAQQPPPGRETVGPTTPIASGTTYVFQKGESWSNVAERTYGDYRWWPFLWDANQAVYPNPDRLKPGANAITIPPASSLPVGKKAVYFARAEEHRKIWSAHKRSRDWGKRLPTLTALVLTPTK